MPRVKAGAVVITLHLLITGHLLCPSLPYVLGGALGSAASDPKLSVVFQLGLANKMNPWEPAEWVEGRNQGASPLT